MSPAYERKKPPFLWRTVRSLISVSILACLILGIGYLVRELSTLNSAKIGYFSKPLLAKIPLKIQGKTLGEVAGKFYERGFGTDIGTAASDVKSPLDSGKSEVKKVVEIKIGVLADVHEDWQNLTRTFTILKTDNVTNIMLLGDITNYGDMPKLEMARQYLSDSGLTYNILPGDHDLAQSLDSSNFSKVFGLPGELVKVKNISILMLDNSANFTPLKEKDLTWFKDNITRVDYVMLAQPLYSDQLNAPFNKMYMGSTADPVEDPKLKASQELELAQRNQLLEIIRNSINIQAVISGDLHKSSDQVDPVRKSLHHITVGAVSSKLNDFPQKALQTPRFSVFTFYSDKTYSIDEVEIQ